MLEAIRKRTGSFVVKFILLVLVLSFVVWGVADVFSPGSGPDWAAEVGDRRISVAEFQEEYRNRLRGLSEAVGTPIDPEQARALGLPATVLEDMVDAALFDLAADDLGITVADGSIREVISANPQFRNDAGRFDADVFRRTLAANGLSEAEYVALLRRDLARRQLITPLSAGVAPAALADILARYQTERRQAEWVVVEASEAIPPPDETAARQFYEANPGLFTAPEYRTAAVVVLSAADFAGTIAVADDDLRAIYEERLQEYSEPERRTFRQAVFTEEAKARAAGERLRQGGDLAAVAADAGGVAPAASIGPASRDQLPSELAGPVFELPSGQWSDPVRSALGWHLVLVTEVVPARVQSFDEVKERLRDEVRREKAIDSMVGLANRLDDVLGRGATLQDAAAETGLSVRTIAAIDAGGRDPTGAAVPDLPEGFVRTLFETEVGTDSGIVEATDDVSFVARAEGVTPSAVLPFEAVRDRVARAWQDDQRAGRARAAAESLAEKARGMNDLRRAATESGRRVVAPPPFTRDDRDGVDVPPILRAALFDAEPGRVVVVGDGPSPWVAQLKSVSPAAADAEATAKQSLQTDLVNGVRADLLRQLATALRQHHDVVVDPRALEQAL